MNEMTDAELQDYVAGLLESDPLIDAVGINVKAELGFITLSGFVQDNEQRVLVEKTLRELPAVKDVFNYLDLRPKGLVGDHNLPHNVI